MCPPPGWDGLDESSHPLARFLAAMVSHWLVHHSRVCPPGTVLARDWRAKRWNRGRAFLLAARNATCYGMLNFRAEILLPTCVQA